MIGHLREQANLAPPESWRRPETHLATLLSDPWYAVLLQISDEVLHSTSAFFRSEGFRNVFVPVTTDSVSSPMGRGSDSLPVRASIEGQDVYLADSMQFLLEAALRIHPRGAYYVSCSFRGERVDTRHLSQFSHAEAEIAGGLDDVMRLAGRYVTFLAERIYENAAGAVRRAAGTLRHLDGLLARRGMIPQVTFREALRELGCDGRWFREIAPGVPSITADGERRLIAIHGGCVWLTHLPRLACPFYQRPDPGTDYSLAADLLLGPGEVVGAGERCPDVATLRESLDHHAVAPEPYAWYEEMKRLSPLRTAGFGMGIERFMQWILGTNDIRNCALFMREHGVVHCP